jgi:hypothetical protein
MAMPAASFPSIRRSSTGTVKIVSVTSGLIG